MLLPILARRRVRRETGCRGAADSRSGSHPQRPRDDAVTRSTPPTDPFAVLVREFELELMHIKQMLALAEDEQRDLVAGDMTRLDAISAEKLGQLRVLELYTNQRAVYLAQQGF